MNAEILSVGTELLLSEILNTDAEGRLVLADVLWHGDEVWVSPDTAQALACEPGDSVRLTPFTPVAGQGEQA